MNNIDVQNLTQDYGGGKGVFDLSFSIPKGEVFGFLGPNGAGKTTVIRHIMGFIRPKAGHCTVDGRDCWREAAAIQEKIGYVPGEIAFFDEMTGTEFLRFVSKYRGLGTKTRESELLERFALDPNTRIKKMSKGTKQKLAITAAFLHDPEILILDEPTGGLDPLMQNQFIALIREEKQRGKTILLSSHIFEEVEQTCGRVGIIRCGRLVTIDTVEALRRQHLRSYKVQLESEEAARDFAMDFSGQQEGVYVTVSAAPSLEEIFLHYYGGEGE